jgi:high-affinity Fe2+/Pb2+ permease
VLALSGGVIYTGVTGLTPHTAAAIAGALVTVLVFFFCRFHVGAVPLPVVLAVAFLRF